MQLELFHCIDLRETYVSLPWQIVVFDDGVEGSRVPKWSEDETETSGAFLTRLLKYMETPQYLRQTLFPKHPTLQFAV